MTKKGDFRSHAHSLDHLNFGHSVLPALLNIIGLASDMGFIAEYVLPKTLYKAPFNRVKISAFVLRF
jgi:hypothetical protein